MIVETDVTQRPTALESAQISREYLRSLGVYREGSLPEERPRLGVGLLGRLVGEEVAAFQAAARNSSQTA